MELARVLDERASDLARALTEEVGLTDREARRFLAEAGPALIRAYESLAPTRPPREPAAGDTVRDVLAGIGGRTLASRVGLSPARTWAGLRAFVPAVMRLAD